MAGVSLYHVIKAAIARIDEKKFKQEKPKNNFNLFFGTISNRQYKDFRKSFLNESDDERLNDILSQVYN